MSFSTNNLQTLPDITTLVTWQNNVTRLNQSNLNNLTGGISSLITSLRGFGEDVTLYFDNIDSQLTTLRNADKTIDEAVKLNTAFRTQHSEDFSGLTEVFRYRYDQNKTTPYAGIVYSDANHPLVISSEFTNLHLISGIVKIPGQLKVSGGVVLENNLVGTSADFSDVVVLNQGQFKNLCVTSEIVSSALSSKNNIIITTPEAKFSQKVSAGTMSSTTATHTNMTVSNYKDSYGNVITDFSKLRLTTETYIAKGPADYTDKSLMV